jgi:hypothetical protein
MKRAVPGMGPGAGKERFKCAKGKFLAAGNLRGEYNRKFR